jgi:glycosyltransferase involved in cell wall biosynthesis
LIYVGVLHYERNLLVFSRALQKAIDEGCDFVLSLVGDGTERKDLEIFARRTDGRIRIVSPVPHNQVPGLLAKSHVGILPFPDEEKFRVSSPIKLFEYMAAGLPILATRIACHTDVVGESDFAFWAEGADEDALLDTLRRVSRSHASLKQMGAQAAFAAQSWTWEASALKIKRALEFGLSNFPGDKPKGR